MDTEINVVIVEDDPMVLELHRQYVARIKGYRLVGSMLNGKDGLEMIIKQQPRLAILDVYMPGMSGLEILKAIRIAGLDTDVILVTAAHDSEMVQQSVQYGAVDYVIKPFTFQRFKKALLNYQHYRGRIIVSDNLSQQEVDAMRVTSPMTGKGEQEGKQSLPKGLQQGTLDLILKRLDKRMDRFTVNDIADDMGISPVTVRRYLTYLQEQGWLQAELSYGPVGRPTNHFFVDRDLHG